MVTSPTSAGSSATPVASRSRLHRSVAAPLSAVAGVGTAVFGVLADMPLLGLAGAVVAAVPAVLAARRVPALQAEVLRYRAEASRAVGAQAPSPAAAIVPAPGPALEVAPVRPFVVASTTTTTAPTTTASSTVDLARAERPAAATEPVPEPVPEPVVDLVKAKVVAPQHVTVGGAPAATGAHAASAAQPRSEGQDDAHARVDTAELQKIWDLGEAPRSRSGHGRRARTGADVDALPDRPRNPSGPRRRARHRA